MKKQKVLKDVDPTEKTNPGSDWSTVHGCVCSKWQNNHGRGNPTMYDRHWWIDEDCPLHKDLL